MAKKKKSDILKANLLKALEKSLGIVTTACKSVDCSRKTFYQYYKEDSDFKEAVDELDNVALDFAESELYKQIRAGVPASTIFLLKTRGRKRGYSEMISVEAQVTYPKEIVFKTKPTNGVLKATNGKS